MTSDIEKKIDIEAIEKKMLEMPQVEFQIEHFFMPGIYIRQMIGLRGTFALGHEHLTEHTNIVIQGSFIVFDGKESYEVKAPYIFKGYPGRKAAFFQEDTIWINIHVTDETDIEKIEQQFIKKSESFLKYDRKERIE